MWNIRSTSNIFALSIVVGVVTGCTAIRNVEIEEQALVSSNSTDLSANLMHLSAAEQACGSAHSGKYFASLSGYGGWGESKNTLYLFDGSEWKLAGKFPSDRLDTTLAFDATDEYIYVAGGNTDWNGEVASAGRFNIEKARYETLSPLNQPRQENITLLSSYGDIVTIGGQAGWQPVNTFEVYNEADDEWTSYPLMAQKSEDLFVATGSYMPEGIFHRQQEFTAVNTSKGILVIGGSRATQYDPVSTLAVGGSVELITKASDGTYSSDLIAPMNIDRTSPSVEVVKLTKDNVNVEFGAIGDEIVFVFSGWQNEISMTSEATPRQGELTYEYLNLNHIADGWKLGVADMPFDRYDSYHFVLNNKIHLVGGWVDSSGTFKDVVFDIKTGTFTTISTNGVDGGMGGAGKVIAANGDEVGVVQFGWGNTLCENSCISPTEYISASTDYLWSNAPRNDMFGHSYEGASVALNDTETLICGGFTSGELLATDICKIYHKDTGLITLAKNMNHARGELFLGKNPVTGEIFALGGTDKWNPVLEIEVYDPEQNTWTDRASLYSSDLDAVPLGIRHPIVSFKKNGSMFIDSANNYDFTYNTVRISADLNTVTTLSTPWYMNFMIPAFYIPLQYETGSILEVDSPELAEMRFGGKGSMIVDVNSDSAMWYDGSSVPLHSVSGSTPILLNNGSMMFLGGSQVRNLPECAGRAVQELALVGDAGICEPSYTVAYPANMLYNTYASEKAEAQTFSTIADPAESTLNPILLEMKDGTILAIGGADFIPYYQLSAVGGLKEMVFIIGTSATYNEYTWSYEGRKYLASYDPKADKWTMGDSILDTSLGAAVGVNNGYTLINGGFAGIDYVAANKAALVNDTNTAVQNVRYSGQLK